MRSFIDEDSHVESSRSKDCDAQRGVEAPARLFAQVASNAGLEVLANHLLRISLLISGKLLLPHFPDLSTARFGGKVTKQERSNKKRHH